MRLVTLLACALLGWPAVAVAQHGGHGGHSSGGHSSGGHSFGGHSFGGHSFGGHLGGHHPGGFFGGGHAGHGIINRYPYGGYGYGYGYAGAPIYYGPTGYASAQVWVPPYWAWRLDRYVWIEGQYAVPPQPGLVWNPPGWVRQPNGSWWYRDAHWGPPAVQPAADVDD